MKTKLVILAFIPIFFISCKKDEGSNTPPPEAKAYMNNTPGSSWTYKVADSSTGTWKDSEFTLTSTARDTSINSRIYHIYSYSYGGSQYLNQSGSDYYEYDSIPAGDGQMFERLYLKSNLPAGGTWSQQVNLSLEVSGIPLTVPLKVSNTIGGKDMSRTVNGVAYDDVIQVNTTISSSSLPPGAIVSDIKTYYAKDYGLIENSSIITIDYMGMNLNVHTITTLSLSVMK